MKAAPPRGWAVRWTVGWTLGVDKGIRRSHVFPCERKNNARQIEWNGMILHVPLGMEMRRTSVGVNGAMVEESWSRRLKAKRCGIFLRVVWLWEGKFLLHAGVWEEKEEERERRDV
eukprot:scaffold2868_cov171-Amphora_coffeaeformis.AAC.5